LADIIGGGTPSTAISNYWDGDIDWYSPVEIGDKIYVNGSQNKITQLGLENSSAKILPVGTVLFTSRAGIGKVAILAKQGSTNQGFQSLLPKQDKLDTYFIYSRAEELKRYSETVGAGSTFIEVSGKQLAKMPIKVPDIKEQNKIGDYFEKIDILITLHQRKFYKNIEKDFKMQRRHKLFVDYYENWIKLYKEGAVKNVTLKKYYLTLTWLKKLVHNLKTNELTRTIYQQLLNDYAKTHEKQTTMDFHHQLKGSILDAVDEGLIANDPTRKVIIKGKKPKEKKIKYLNQFQLQTLISNLELSSKINADWLILIIAKTGMRFSEALGLTAKDFDYANQTISINKTWDYKGIGGFQETKNKSSIRKIQIDWKTVTQFAGLLNNLDKNKPIFIDGKTYNSTINQILARHCKRVNIPQISIHGLRHTHASLLLYSGFSIASVARRLGHASMTTTQKIYLHVIQELENKDIDQVMRLLSGLN